ncbi:DNA repair protein RecO [Limosilactobacillus sp. STM2_1]|uniref:DNA repair protein RecO n=1 Tax=Limosilactobacillus rudii TaxID=2759755 RepID=A0A7W3UJU3_9LACO|nr:DNA repair protein RecO [Limosilactobacillus rudii]MBB1078332.1 DNA repair protein RecO [Limosilactobacillus rudii]MBB1096928.1 DNA repair protein RecO [Limosilactobacillus rudii]MCD7134072.1 DNA repair protein RecO [Limosilactobacillus rudii]
MARVTTQFTGIIMYRQDYRERDLLVKMLTDKIGPAMFFVKNAKKRGFRMTADILPFTHGTYIGSLDNNGLSFINAASDVKQYSNVAGDINKNAYVTYILALVDSAFNDGKSIGAWFNQVAAALDLIDKGRDEQVVTNIIETQLLVAFGVAPVWDQCVVCGRSDIPLDFSEQYGGMLCQNHWHLDSHRMYLDRKTVYYLQQFARINLQKLNSIRINNQTKQRLQLVLDTIYDNQVGLNLKSKHFIKQMRKWEQNIGKLSLGD